MFWAGYGGGKCKKGGIHSSQGFDFVLPHSEVREGSQSNWRFCKNCHVMFFNGYAGGQCVAGGPHVADWLDFSLPYGGLTSATTQSGWRFCGGCHTLFLAAVEGGVCVAAEGPHSPQGTFTFVLPHVNPAEDTAEQKTAVSIAEGLALERGVWPYVKPWDLVDSLTQRIRAPSKVNQGQTMNCAPAAVAYTLARYKPVLYAEAVAGLYKTGHAPSLPGPGFGVLGDKQLAASDYLRYVNYTQFFGIIATANRPEADWILLSSIRNSENWFNQYWGTAGLGSAGAGWINAITAPETFEGWLHSFGYTKTIRKANATTPLDLSFLREASDLFGNNWRVFLLLNINVLSEEKQANMSFTADHYVTLTSMVQFSRGYVNQYGTDEYIEFNCATWGRTTQHVPVGKTKLLGSDFIKNFYGFVAATN